MNISPLEPPKIWMPADRKKYRENLSQYTQNADELDAWWAVIRSVYAILDEECLSMENLDILSNAMESKWKQVWGEAGKRLFQLSQYYPRVTQTIKDLVNHRNGSIRLRMIQSLWADLPLLPLCQDLLSVGLKDSSAKIRLFSAQRAQQFRILQFVPTIQSAYEQETNSKIKKSLLFSLRLLRDGYFLEASKDGIRQQLVFQGEDGTIRGEIVPISECTPDRILELVHSFQDKHKKHN